MRQIQNMIFYSIKGNDILYLIINNNGGYCINFKFSNYNYISLIKNEEYINPVIISNQYIETTIRNVVYKHFKFYLKYLSNYIGWI
jgi:hypothetical protein